MRDLEKSFKKIMGYLLILQSTISFTLRVEPAFRSVFFLFFFNINIQYKVLETNRFDKELTPRRPGKARSSFQNTSSM